MVVPGADAAVTNGSIRLPPEGRRAEKSRPIDQAALEAAHCWETDDRVPGPVEFTDFRRALRLRQAQWRERHGHPIGTQPIVPKAGKPQRPVGSRMPFDYARQTAANFVTPAAVEAARARADTPERHQTFDHQRIWADLLSSPSLAVNLLGDLAADPARADKVIHMLWPDAPGHVVGVRFAHSPGRFDPTYLNSLRAFDAAVFLDTGSVIAVDINYHDWLKPEIPRPENVPRYLEVARRSRAFARGAAETLKERGPLAVMWLEHLLLLSMLQHPSGEFTWGRYVAVYPANNTSLADGTKRYVQLLADNMTFAAVTLEQIVRALPLNARRTVRARYLA